MPFPCFGNGIFMHQRRHFLALEMPFVLKSTQSFIIYYKIYLKKII